MADGPVRDDRRGTRFGTTSVAWLVLSTFMATKRSHEEPVTVIRDVLEDSSEVELAVLFGSAARKEIGSGPDSDLDIGLLLHDGSDDSQTRRTLRRRLRSAVETTLDVVFLGDAPPLLRFEIARDGRVLLERHAHTWSDFKMRAMIDWWDWARYARIMQEAAVRRLRQSLADPRIEDVADGPS